MNAILQASTHVEIVTTIALQYAPLSEKVLNILLVVELLIYSKKIFPQAEQKLFIYLKIHDHH